MKKQIRKITAEVRTMLEPAAILKLYPMNSPVADEIAPMVEERIIITFKLLENK